MKRVVWLLILLASCIDPYVPSELKPAGAILVIDGHIDPTGKSEIKITKSQNLFDKALPETVENAGVWLESISGVQYSLTEGESGIYELPQLNLTESQYKLHVKTADSKEYESDFVPVVNSPEIDSVSWKVSSDLGVNIFANTHDDQNKAGFYKWRFEETWQTTAAYQSIYQFNGSTGQVELRKEDIFNCWQTQNSSDILINSTKKLNTNKVSEFLLTHIIQKDVRLRFTYSILVQQLALTEEAYSYWKQIKSTTENLGTIFSPIPSQVRGNYKSLTNPEETVLGYFSIGYTSKRRIFINSMQLPRPNTYNTPYAGCILYEVSISNAGNATGPYLLVGGVPNPNGPGIVGYSYALSNCVDCRLAGGTNVKPDFWP